MSPSKTKIVAGLQVAPAVLTAIIGYFVLVPRFGRWGVAFTAIASALALYWLGVLLFRRRTPDRSVETTRGTGL
jgi:hypothetical protein